MASTTDNPDHNISENDDIYARVGYATTIRRHSSMATPRTKAPVPPPVARKASHPGHLPVSGSDVTGESLKMASVETMQGQPQVLRVDMEKVVLRKTETKCKQDGCQTDDVNKHGDASTHLLPFEVRLRPVDRCEKNVSFDDVTAVKDPMLPPPPENTEEASCEVFPPAPPPLPSALVMQAMAAASMRKPGK